MIWDYKVTGAYKSLREADQAVLDQIAKYGDDFSQPRHTLLFFLHFDGAARASVDLIAGDASRFGLSVSRLDDSTLILEGQCRVDPDNLMPLVDWAVRIAEEANADFDGWECAVIAPKH